MSTNNKTNTSDNSGTDSLSTLSQIISAYSEKEYQELQKKLIYNVKNKNPWQYRHRKGINND